MTIARLEANVKLVTRLEGGTIRGGWYVSSMRGINGFLAGFSGLFLGFGWDILGFVWVCRKVDVVDFIVLDGFVMDFCDFLVGRPETSAIAMEAKGPRVGVMDGAWCRDGIVKSDLTIAHEG